MTSEPKVDQLLRNLEQLFVDGQNSDITLKVKDREFAAHKGILTVRSPVFACMFKYDTVEKSNGVVTIPDCTPEAFEIFLLYLYTGNVNTITVENVFSVYYIADKYCIDDLKDHIINFLKESINLDTCLEIFTVATQHSDLKLQDMCIEFFYEHFKEITKTEKWEKYRQEYPFHGYELFRGMLDYLKKWNDKASSERKAKAQ